MNRWVGILVGSMAAVLYLFPVSGEAPPGQPAAPAEAIAAPAPAVRLQHQLITVTPAPSRPKPAKPNGAARSARATLSRPAGPVQPTMMARARRMLFGDGSHRPEPFPRPGRP